MSRLFLVNHVQNLIFIYLILNLNSQKKVEFQIDTMACLMKALSYILLQQK